MMEAYGWNVDTLFQEEIDTFLTKKELVKKKMAEKAHPKAVCPHCGSTQWQWHNQRLGRRMCVRCNRSWREKKE